MLKAHVVGSMLRPGRLLEHSAQYRAGALAVAEFKRIEDAAVDQAIAVQEQAGTSISSPMASSAGLRSVTCSVSPCWAWSRNRLRR